jgi:hypothetical protein
LFGRHCRDDFPVPRCLATVTLRLVSAGKAKGPDLRQHLHGDAAIASV